MCIYIYIYIHNKCDSANIYRFSDTFNTILRVQEDFIRTSCCETHLLV